VLCLSWEQTSFINPNALFFKGYISAESIPVLCLLWEQTSFISPSALFLLGLHTAESIPYALSFVGTNKLY